MTIKQFTFNPFSENTYVVHDETGECIIIDPGCHETHEMQELDGYIEDNQLTVKALINTHCHIDHVLGNDHVKNKYKVELYIHPMDVATLKANEVVAPMYGIQGYQTTQAEKYLNEGDVFAFGKTSFEIEFVPGHAPGHIALINKEEKVCISGDVLFQGSIGRTDLPGGDFDTLMRSIKEKLFQLGDDFVVYCGHGPNTSIGFEKEHNPFCGTYVN